MVNGNYVMDLIGTYQPSMSFNRKRGKDEVKECFGSIIGYVDFTSLGRTRAECETDGV